MTLVAEANPRLGEVWVDSRRNCSMGFDHLENLAADLETFIVQAQKDDEARVVE